MARGGDVLKKQHLKSFKKRTILVVSAIGVFGLVVGGTLAISHDRSVMKSKFRLAGYHTLFTEEFDAPQNWMTCETIDKTLTVTNDSDSSGAVAVRVKLEEQWIASDGVTELPLVSATSGFTMAQIDFTPNSGWTKEGSYYYYETNLAKGTTTTSLISGVTLNCDANLDTTATAAANADGAYANANYKLKITAQTIDAENKDVWDTTLAGMIKKQANNLGDYTIDFTRKAVVSDDVYTANGNGIDKYKENNQDIYYYRGQIDDNNIIWADKCWKIVRTTATGGTKIIYNGTPSDVVVDGETVKQCLATGAGSQITVNVGGMDANSFNYSDVNANSPADVGYMYGARITTKMTSGNLVFTFSNDVNRNNNAYTLDTDIGQSISGTWTNEFSNASSRYHYFCTDGSVSCNNTKIGYIHYFKNSSNISYLKVDGYSNIEDMKVAMFTNTTDSNAKAMIDAWFEQQNLDGHIAGSRNYENDLEDVVFCNDRSYYSGSLKGKDSNAGPDDDVTQSSYHGAYGRNAIKNAANNYEPSLNCAEKNDSLSVIESATSNGKLRYRIGLITADELTLSGINFNEESSENYLYNGQRVWSASPSVFTNNVANVFMWFSKLSYGSSYNNKSGLRPMVSLKAGTEVSSGSGLKTDPYIIE